MEIRRGDIVRVDFGTVIGSEQGGQRPAVVVQNDVGNMRAPTCIVLPMTSSSTKASLPTHCRIAPTNNTGLRVESVVLAEQFRTVDKVRIIDKIGSLNEIAPQSPCFSYGVKERR